MLCVTALLANGDMSNATTKNFLSIIYHSKYISDIVEIYVMYVWDVLDI